jgi:succinate-semialdehyde dehydrogenase/glutarate-semialdehyde dehydrogenase
MSPVTVSPNVVSMLLQKVPTDLYIDGRWQPSSSGRRFYVDDPATGERLATVADASPEDGMAALSAADGAQEAWASTPPRVRSETLSRAFQIVMERTDEVALLMTLEMGKSLTESRAEVTYGAEFFRWFADEAVRIDGNYRTAPDGVNRLLVLKRPVGPTLLITPWNFPLAMATRKIGPALAAGCAVVLKPAPQTPLTSLWLAQVLEEAGVPAGVVNVIPTVNAAATTAPVLADRRLRKLSFTGSTPVGRALLAQAAGNVLRTSMELGGNAPFIVFDDADLDLAVEGAMAAKFRNIGQACTAANRFLVHEAVAQEFTERLVAKVRTLSIGPGTDSNATLGPLVDEGARRKVHGLVTDALGKGARLLAGGVIPQGPGHFYPGTVIVNVPSEAEIHQEEIFGPVASLRTFIDEADAVRLANESDFGLVAYVFTGDFGRGLRLAEKLEFGMLGLNAGVISTPAAPFGGVKQSGLGREGSHEGLEEYLETVYMGIGDPNVVP